MSHECGCNAIQIYNVMLLCWLHNVFMYSYIRQDVIVQNTPNWQTLDQVVQEIHMSRCLISGLVNGWCVSINRMIKAPGPPLHVCYVRVQVMSNAISPSS
jgi:hypothetical protein